MRRPPRDFVRMLRRYSRNREGTAGRLRCRWSPRRTRFIIERRVRMPGGSPGWQFVVASQNPDPPHQRREPGEWLLRHLDKLDAWRRYRNREHFIEKELEEAWRDRGRKRADEEADEHAEIVREAEDFTRDKALMVPGTKGPVAGGKHHDKRL